MPGVVAPGDYSDYEAVQQVIAAAQEAGVDPDWAQHLIDAAERQQSILDAISRPAEKTKAWYEYRKIFLTDRRIREGAIFWSAHADTLQAVAARTGGIFSVKRALAQNYGLRMGKGRPPVRWTRVERGAEDQGGEGGSGRGALR